MYLYSKKAALSIHKRLPEVKIIAILRQPVDRLYSRFMHLSRESRSPGPFEDALQRESIWWRRNDLVTEGFYHQHLSEYYRLFRKDQIKVVLYEDFQTHPLDVLSEIFQFIGVDSGFHPSIHRAYNVSGTIVNPAVDKLIGQKSILKKALFHLHPKIEEWIRSKQQIREFVNLLRIRNLKKDPLDPILRSKMTSSIYANDILHLQGLLHRNLTAWLS